METSADGNEGISNWDTSPSASGRQASRGNAPKDQPCSCVGCAHPPCEQVYEALSELVDRRLTEMETRLMARIELVAADLREALAQAFSASASAHRASACYVVAADERNYCSCARAEEGAPEAGGGSSPGRLQSSNVIIPKCQ